MGVEFIKCHGCADTFPDCGEFRRCNEDAGGCGKVYCSTACGDVLERDVDSCKDCRGKYASDLNVLNFLLMASGLTREDANKLYLENEARKRGKTQT